MRALKIKDVEIDAICDIKEETADSAVQEFGGKKYASYQQMLEREELDAVYVVLFRPSLITMQRSWPLRKAFICS